MKPSDLTYAGLTAEESFVVNWQFRRFDLQDFASAFLKAALAADDENLDRLALGFPVEVIAIRRYWHEVGWWDGVLKKAIQLGVLPERSQ